MLTILFSRDAAALTRELLKRIASAAGEKREGMLLLVPEQFSHRAERSMAQLCGDGISLAAEVLSFTRLASRVAAECGGAADIAPDKGARLLMMSLAVSSVAEKLTICGGRGERVRFLESILRAKEELDACLVRPDDMRDAAERSEGTVSQKLHDMALISEAYDAVRASRLTDPRDKTERLAEILPLSTVGAGGIYADGFTDFTKTELAVLESVLRRGTDLTVALTTDLTGADEFAIPDKTISVLSAMARRRGVRCEITQIKEPGGRAAAELEYLTRSLYDYGAAPFTGECRTLELYTMDDALSECELAASLAGEMLRKDPTLRCRDIAVALCGFSGYEAVAESVFSLYGIPRYSGRRADILQKSAIKLAVSALAAVTGGYRYEDVFTYLKTGLTGMDAGDRDRLENYCLLWNLRGENVWTSAEPWRLSPSGFVSETSQEDYKTLLYIDELRRQAAAPLAELRRAGKAASTARGQVMALYSLLDGLELAERLSERAGRLRSEGDIQGADETAQIWGVLVGALEQCDSVLGEMPMTQEEFAKLFPLVLSQYSVATIPALADSVTLCDIEALRGASFRVLMIIGASSDALPQPADKTRLFSEEERNKLLELGLELGDSGDESVSRELFSIYSAFSCASEKIIITWPQGGSEPSRPSFIIGRAASLINIRPVSEAELGDYFRATAPEPCFLLAAAGKSPLAPAAAACVESTTEGAARLADLRARVLAPRGSLSQSSVTALFGKEFRVSASRAETYNSCRFSYFMQYGLRAKPRKKAGFAAPELGSFVHYILENVSREVKKLGGFSAVDMDLCRMLCREYIKKYTDITIGPAQNRSSRFMYLFVRLQYAVERIVEDVAGELMNSDFEPLDFELHFDRGADMPPAELKKGDMSLCVNGLVDRVDGWLHADTLYLRVADYKTGKKGFSLSDVWYGLGIQMLVYLFVLAEHGEARYGKKIVPAGVLYSPARDMILDMPKESTDEQLEKERTRLLRRSGIVLDDPKVIEAMEHSQSPKYIPVTFKNGEPSGSLITAERIGRLASYVKELLTSMGTQMKDGSINADPYDNGSMRYCSWCEYASACRFDESRDTVRRLSKISDADFWDRLERGGADGG